MNDGESATAVLPHYDQACMTLFSYGFGMAMSFAITIAIGNAWARDHRRGVWTISMVAILIVTGVILGVLFGWSLNTYLNFVSASATGRI
jgi:MFS family permease